MAITLQELSLVEKVELIQVHFTHTTLEGPTEYVNARWMLNSISIPTWHQSNHVSWSLGLFKKKHLLEVGLTQNRENMALRMLTTINLSYFNMCEDPHEWKFIEIVCG